MKKQILVIVGIILLAVNALAEMTAEEAIKESYRRYRQIKSERVEVTVDDGDIKKMIWLAAYDYGESNHDIEMSLFVYPPMDAGFKVFIERSDDLDYDRIVVKRPSYNKKRTVSGSNEGKSYAGDFNFQDARESTNMKFTLYDWAWEEVEARVIVQTPKKGTQSLYGKKKYWLDDAFRMLKIEFYDSRNRLWKVWRNLEFDELRGEAWRIKVFEIENILRKRSTKITFANRIINFKVSESMFDENIFFSK